MTRQADREIPPLEGVARLPKHVVYRAFVSETVVLNLDTGKYHGLNATGGRMLEVITTTATVREAIQSLAEEYAHPVDRVEQDVERFCLDLAARGLIEISPNGSH